MRLSNSYQKSSITSIEERMLVTADRGLGELKGLAHELGSLADGVDDNALKQALRHAAQMMGSGFGGYTVGFILDNFSSVEVLLP